MTAPKHIYLDAGHDGLDPDELRDLTEPEWCIDPIRYTLTTGPEYQSLIDRARAELKISANSFGPLLDLVVYLEAK